MADMDERAANVIESVLSFVVSIILGILAFFVTVFVVITGADLAGVTASGDFVVLSAALIVVASMLSGGRAYQTVN